MIDCLQIRRNRIRKEINMEYLSAYCDSCHKPQPVAIIKNKRSRHVRAYCMKCYNWIRSDYEADKAELRKKVKQ